MDSKETYAIPVKTYTEIEVDFEKLYNYIVQKTNIEDPDEIYNEFGDNIDFYLKEALNIEFDDTYFDEDDYIFEDNIWGDFGDWLDENIVKE